VHLDPLSQRLLALLQEDPRANPTELARRLQVSPPTVRERLARLEDAGVILGFRVVLDPVALGLPVAAWVRVRPGPGQLPKIAALAEATPEVSECYRISGEDCFLMQVHVPTIQDLEGVLDRFLRHGQTTSSFVVATPVAPRVPTRSADAGR
jgi:Lrp/AsnC family leucine-responsive transcriptional regulator